MNAFTRPRYVYGYGPGFDYKSSITVGGWPLVHVCAGVDPDTMRPRIAKGVIAIGNISIGVVAIGGLACGLITVGGASLGLLLAVGGAAFGAGLSIGGLAVGSIAIGGAAIGFQYAVGGVAIAPAALDSMRCDGALLDAARRWIGPIRPPANCR
jgi:hypothetical protein